MERCILFDTTLRDGNQRLEQPLGAEEKILIAQLLELARVDVIELGFPASSPEDQRAFQLAQGELNSAVVCALARTDEADIKSSLDCLKGIARPRLHVYHAASDALLAHKYGVSREQALERVKVALHLALELWPGLDLQFGIEDATRADPIYLKEMVRVAAQAGAQTITLADTVGICQPGQYGKLVARIKRVLAAYPEVVLGVHCHNDLGQAVANSLVGLRAGARQVEVTVLGIGERAGNTALEPVLMSLLLNSDYYGLRVGMDSSQVTNLAKMAAGAMGYPIPEHTPVVGDIWTQRAGGHQKAYLDYRIFSPEKVGADPGSPISLTTQSGPSGLECKAKELGYLLTREQIAAAYRQFMLHTGASTQDIELIQLIERVLGAPKTRFRLKSLHVSTSISRSSKQIPTSLIGIETLRPNGRVEESFTSTAGGRNMVDAVCKCIGAIVPVPQHRLSLAQQQMRSGTDSPVVAHVQLVDLQTAKIYNGVASAPEAVEATAEAYLYALNRLHADS